MVDYDSIIPPGRAGKVVQQIAINKLNSGTFNKSVRVVSNAKNIPMLRLGVSGKILSVINLSTRFLHLRATDEGKVTGTFELTAEKNNFQISKILFEEHAGSEPAWQKPPALIFHHTMSRSDKPDTDGYYTYTVSISLDIAPSKRLSGIFFVHTNHPKSEKIEIRGMIAPVDEN